MNVLIDEGRRGPKTATGTIDLEVLATCRGVDVYSEGIDRKCGYVIADSGSRLPGRSAIYAAKQTTSGRKDVPAAGSNEGTFEIGPRNPRHVVHPGESAVCGPVESACGRSGEH